MNNNEDILTMNTSSENAIVFIVVMGIIVMGIYILYRMKDEIEEQFTSYIKKNTYDADVLVRYINLTRKKERNEAIINQLNKSNVIKDIYKRVDAIDGKEVNLSKFSNFDSSYESLNKKRGWIGCAESHQKVWTECVNEDKNMIIFEDDVVIKDMYDENIEKSLTNLPEGFDIIYYNTVNYAVHEPYNKLYNRLTNKNYITTNYLVSPKGADKLLKYTTPYNPAKQIDSYIVEMTQHKLLDTYLFKLPTTYSVQDYNESDIQESKNVIKIHDIHAKLV